VEGFADRRDTRRYACELLKNGFIRHTVNKMSFSEQCYYTVAEICSGKSESNESNSVLTVYCTLLGAGFF